VKKGFYHSHLMTKKDFEKEMKPTMLPDKLTKAEGISIWDWWRGDKKKFVTGERTKRESEENKAKHTTKTDKVEVKNEDEPFPDEETITAEDMPE